MKIGVLGAGNWGRRHIKEYYNLNHEVVVFDLLKENLDWCKKEFGASVVDSYKKILDDDSIKYVSICTPNPTHYPLGIECLNANKNVLIEKPLAENSTDALKLFELAKKKELVLMAGHVFRFNNAVHKTKELLLSGSMGKIFQVRCDWHQNISPKDYRDIVLDIGLHPLDIVNYLFNKLPPKIHCVRRSFNKRFSDIAILNFEIQTDDLLIFFIIDLNWLTPLKSRTITVVGSNKTIQVQCIDQKVLLIDNKNEKSINVDIVPNDPLSDELNFFLTCNQEKLIEDIEKPNGLVATDVLKMIEMTNKAF